MMPVEKLTGGHNQTMRTSEATSRFLSRPAAKKWSPKTRESYYWAFSYLQSNELPDDTETLESLLGLAADRLSESSLHDVWRRWRTFYRWAAQRLETRNPIERIDPASGRVDFLLEKPKSPVLWPRILTTEQIRTLFQNGCSTRRDQLMILVPLDMGLRLSEVAQLSKMALSPEGVRITGKGKKTRIVPISQDLCSELRHTGGSSDSPWTDKEDRPLVHSGVKSAYRRIFANAGIKAGAHSLRHTFATRYLRRGGAVWALQRILGHSSVNTTEIYLHMVADDLVRDHRMVSPLEEWTSCLAQMAAD